MASNSPVFPMPDPQHFSDYGFDPQLNYFEVLEEAMKHKRETERSIDSIRFKLQKLIAKDNSGKVRNKPNKKSWWQNLFKWKWAHRDHHHHHEEVHQACRPHDQAFRASISGPVYLTDSSSGPTSPYRPSSGSLAGTLTPAAKVQGRVGVPYMSLGELNMEQQQRMSTSALPPYLVTSLEQTH